MMNKVMMPGSKWIKHRAIYESEFLRLHLPDTDIYSDTQLRGYLEQYSVVFVKPAVGGGGKKIFRIKKSANGQYLVSLKKEQRAYTSLSDVHHWIESTAESRQFLIQNGIDLAYWKGRPVDIRVIVQLNTKGDWEVSGILAKRAGANLAVTNVAAGGHVYPIETYLQELGYSKARIQEQIVSLKEVSLAIARQLHHTYANAIYGLDVGMDQQGHFWLIEANTVPNLSAFKKTQPQVFAKIMRLWNLNRSVNGEAARMLMRRHQQDRAKRSQQRP